MEHNVILALLVILILLQVYQAYQAYQKPSEDYQVTLDQSFDTALALMNALNNQQKNQQPLQQGGPTLACTPEKSLAGLC